MIAAIQVTEATSDQQHVTCLTSWHVCSSVVTVPWHARLWLPPLLNVGCSLTCMPSDRDNALRAGIGLPAVAASGTIAANTLLPVSKHIELLDEIGV